MVRGVFTPVIQQIPLPPVVQAAVSPRAHPIDTTLFRVYLDANNQVHYIDGAKFVNFIIVLGIKIIVCTVVLIIVYKVTRILLNILYNYVKFQYEKTTYFKTKQISNKSRSNNFIQYRN